MPSEQLDEAALRREDFVEGTPVTLADGQVWQLRKPVMRFVPSDASPAGFRVCLRLNGADDYQAMLDEYNALFGQGDSVKVSDLARAELAIGRALLEANYALDVGQLASLLQFGYDPEEDPEGDRIREEVMGCALGRGPKPSPDGTDASPMPSGD